MTHVAHDAIKKKKEKRKKKKTRTRIKNNNVKSFSLETIYWSTIEHTGKTGNIFFISIILAVKQKLANFFLDHEYPQRQRSRLNYKKHIN